jgi:DamX protein
MNNSVSENKYYLEYGLEKDPFPEDVIDKNIYLTPEINRRLKETKQHIKASEKALLISSVSGAGKSLLAQKLIILKEQDWRISLTSAHSGSEPESIAHSIIQQLLPDREIVASQSISMMHKFLEESYQDGILPVVVIDDAHKLSFSTLQFLLQLADLRYNDAFFRFVFFANESITETISKPGLKELAEGTIDTLSMPCFTKDQIGAYLKYRFSSCGDNIEIPFSESEIEYIHKASGGLPGGVNILARQLMQANLNKDTGGKSYGGITFILILLLVSFTGYQYYENGILKEARQPISDEIQEKSVEATNTENLLTTVEEDQSSAIQQDDAQGRASIIYEPLSLQLSYVLNMEPKETVESTEEL